MGRDELLSTGRSRPPVRQLVFESWRRSVHHGFDPERALAAIRLDDAALAETRRTHPLASSMPLIRRLLVEPAADAGLIVAVSDATGQLLWVEGDSSLRSRAEDIHFLAGADWSESSAGTNAPGTALALDRPVQISGPEHLAHQVTPWSCSAVPIHDPDTSAVLGVLDVTGGPDVTSAQSLTLVRATVAAVEAELRLERLDPSAAGTTGPGRTAPVLEVLGRRGATLRHGSTTTRLSLRHSEIVLLIAESEDGMTSAELAVALNEAEQAAVTTRAEVSRLRAVLDPIELGSRPYRLRTRVDTDIGRIRRDLASGRLRRAAAGYRGPILPLSTSPAVVRLRDELHMAVRSSVLAAGDSQAVLSFAETAHGRDDFEIWDHALAMLAPTSPRYAQVAARVARLEVELG